MPQGPVAVIYAVVDQQDLVAESNEDDNTETFDISGSDLGIHQNYSYYRGDDGSLEIKLTIQNYNCSESGPHTLNLFKIGGGTQPIWTQARIPLGGNGTSTVTISLPPGSHPDSTESMEFRAEITGGETANPDFEDNNSLVLGTFADPDRDGDGIPNLDEPLIGFDPENPLDGAADYDFDGIRNAAEFIAGTNMQSAASMFSVTELGRQPSSLPEHFAVQLKWPSVAGRNYRVEYSTDLKSWTPVESSIAATPPFNIFQANVPATVKTGFFRVVVRRAL